MRTRSSLFQTTDCFFNGRFCSIFGLSRADRLSFRNSISKTRIFPSHACFSRESLECAYRHTLFNRNFSDLSSVKKRSSSSSSEIVQILRRDKKITKDFEIWVIFFPLHISIFPFSPPLPCHPWVSFFPFFSFPHPETLLYPVPPIPTCLVGSTEIHYTLPTTFCYTHHGRMREREREKISLGRKIPLYLRGCFSPFPTL